MTSTENREDKTPRWKRARDRLDDGNIILESRWQADVSSGVPRPYVREDAGIFQIRRRAEKTLGKSAHTMQFPRKDPRTRIR